MNKKTHEFIVGIFVIAGILCLGFLAAKVSGLSVSSLNQKTYIVTAEFTDIGSLRKNAAVRIAGVEIGSVTSIKLTTNYSGFIALVTLKLDKQYDKIPSDYSASIQTMGLLGESYIALEPAKINLPNLNNSQYLQDNAKIGLANTSSAMNLNALISTFASGTNKSKE